MTKQRKQEGQLYLESELWYLLYALVHAKADVPSRRLGDIKPENVFANSTGQVKVVNEWSWPNENSSFVQALENMNATFTSLLAPEDMVELSRGIIDNSKNDQS